jgi:hypothetical protein
MHDSAFDEKEILIIAESHKYGRRGGIHLVTSATGSFSVSSEDSCARGQIEQHCGQAWHIHTQELRRYSGSDARNIAGLQSSITVLGLIADTEPHAGQDGDSHRQHHSTSSAKHSLTHEVYDTSTPTHHTTAPCI